MKTFSNYMRAFLIVIGMSIGTTAMAGVVTFNATNDHGDAANSITKSGVTISAPVGKGSFDGTYTNYRWYSDASGKLTFSCDAKMTQIQFTIDGTGSLSNISLSSGGGSYSTSNGKWTYASGSYEVKFSNGGNQIRFSEIEVTIESTDCELKVFNGSSYITWRTISQEDPLPCAPEIAGYYLMTGGSELCDWSTTTISTTPCVSSAYASGNNYRYAVANPYMDKHYPNGATTLYAVYVKEGESCQTTTAPYANNFWTVTFKANGGTGSDYTQDVVKSSPTKLYANRFTRTGYDFAGWATSSGGTKVYNDEAKITATANTTLWAKWTPKKYTIMTEVSGCGGGSCTATIAGETIIELDYGTTGLALVATASSGYYFNGWAKSPNTSAGGTIANAANASTTYNVGTDDATLTASFLPYLHVTYDANGGNSAPTDATDYRKNANVSISNSIPTKSGFTFIGWATSSSRANAGTVDYTRNQSNAFQITADKTLYAVWCTTITGASLTVSGTTPTFNYTTGKGSTTFSWGSVTGATAYQLVIRNTTDGEDVHSGAVSASSSYEFTNMTPGKTYRATVTASNACTETSGSVEKSIACPSIAWAGSASDIVVSTPGKNSATVTFTITNAASFEVWLTDGTAAGSEVVGSRSEITANSSGVASKEFTGLTSDHTYYVHAIGENICGNNTAEKQDVSFETAHQEVYDTYQFTCVNFTATVPSGKAFVTSGNGKTILAKHPVHLVITGGLANHFVQIEPSTAELSVYYIDSDSKYQVVNNSHQLRIGADGTFEKDIYFAYTPVGEGNGSVTVPTFTVRCDGFEQVFNTDGSLMKVRALPESFAIIGKVGNTWYALPADMSNKNGTQPAVAVRVDDNANPTVAYTEAADNAFRIWPIDAPGGGNFKSTAADKNGAIIRLSMPNNMNGESKAYAFGASESSTAIGVFNNATLTASNDGVGSHSYWDVTTNENVVGDDTYFKYELFNPARGSNKQLAISNKKWGTYGGAQELRFVTIEEKKDAELTIMEWGADAVVVRYQGSGTIALTGVSVNNAALGSAYISRIGTSDLYRIDGLTTLQANPSRLLVISIDETVAAVTTAKESVFNIPFIISDGQTKTNTELRSVMDGNTDAEKGNLAKTQDVIVLKGGQFTTANTVGAFQDMYIYQGGKVNLGHNIGLQNIFLRGGYCWLTSNFALPQMKVTNDISITGIGTSGNGIFYDLYLNNDIAYMTAFPANMPLTSITNEEGGDDWDAWIKEYNGEGRVSTPRVSGWQYPAGYPMTATIERGKGYEIGIHPRLGRPYGILRFPLHSGAWSNEQECNPSVVAWGMTDGDVDEGVTPNNAGWNFLGNPFYSAYNNTVGEESIIIADSLTKNIDANGNWTGTYKWIGQRVKYFTIPHYTYEEYFDVRATPYQLDAFYPFFVQVSSGTKASPASLTFGTDNRVLKLAARGTTAQPREVNVDWFLQDDLSHQDVAGLNISNEYSEIFDSEDKEKTIANGTQYLKVYTLVGTYRVAYNSLPEETAENPIPVGYIAPEAGYYTFTINDDGYYSELEYLWLTDLEQNKKVDLLIDDYRFYSAPGQYEERFVINAVLKKEQDTPTDIQNDESNDEMMAPIKFIWHDKMYILHRGVIYDATGKKVK